MLDIERITEENNERFDTLKARISRTILEEYHRAGGKDMEKAAKFAKYICDNQLEQLNVKLEEAEAVLDSGRVSGYRMPENFEELGKCIGDDFTWLAANNKEAISDYILEGFRYSLNNIANDCDTLKEFKSKLKKLEEDCRAEAIDTICEEWHNMDAVDDLTELLTNDEWLKMGNKLFEGLDADIVPTIWKGFENFKKYDIKGEKPEKMDAFIAISFHQLVHGGAWYHLPKFFKDLEKVEG